MQRHRNVIRQPAPYSQYIDASYVIMRIKLPWPDSVTAGDLSIALVGKLIMARIQDSFTMAQIARQQPDRRSY